MLAAGVAGILVGLAIGLAAGGGDEDTDPVQGLRDARSSLTRAASLLDIVTVEYPQGVQNGEVASAPEYQGAVRAIGRSRNLYGEARPVLAYVSTDLVARTDAAYRRLREAANARAPAERVTAEARRLAAVLEGALDGG